MKKHKMPKATEILNHWYKTLTENYGKGLDDDWSGKPNATFICFACNMDAGTERCHILPRCEGGSDEVHNLHLLCKECHLESETLSGDVYWQWLQSKDYSNSGSFLRVWNKAKIMAQLHKEQKFSIIPPDVLVGINNFLNT
jgi:hypothetical protein